MPHYYAVADDTLWISFPSRNGMISAADGGREIISQARDALASVAMDGGRLPRSAEDDTKLPIDFSEIEQRAMAAIPFQEAAAVAQAV